ncbi:MAG: enoyl-CoA hydratase/isomerase family protein [Pseudomonadota bacterium]|jgi:enoyl-CoA hydratase/carnithine racemase
MYATIELTLHDSTQVIRLNRPDRRNAISREMMAEIMQAARAAQDAGSVRAVVITGGDSYFSAGADLNEAIAVRSAVEGSEYFRLWHDLTATLEQLRLPVVAAIEGFCITGGLELALACDLRVAAEGSTYAITSARIGTVAGAGGTQRLPRLVGQSRALHLLMSAQTIDAAEALRIGLVDRLTRPGAALAAALEWCEMYAQRAPLSVAFAKRAVHRGMQMDLASALEFETMLVTTVYGTADKQEGIGAFLEKRPPKFTGR